MLIADVDTVYVPQIEDCIEHDQSIEAVNVWDGFGRFYDRKFAIAECYRLASTALTDHRYDIPKGHHHAVALCVYHVCNGEQTIQDCIDIVPNVEQEGVCNV